MFGVTVSEMVSRDLADFIPRACPSRNAEDLLIVGDASTSKKGGLGGKKKVVGKLMPLVGVLSSSDTKLSSCHAGANGVRPTQLPA